MALCLEMDAEVIKDNADQCGAQGPPLVHLSLGRAPELPQTFMLMASQVYNDCLAASILPCTPLRCNDDQSGGCCTLSYTFFKIQD